jgi:transcription antitermination factor NusG
MSGKTIQEALAEIQRKINEQRMKNAEANWNAIQEAPIVTKDELAAFQKTNPGATLGQYMNQQQGLTARKGGANDPSVIAKQRDIGAAAGPVQPTYDPSKLTAGPRSNQNVPAAAKKFQGTIADYQKLNPGASIGQAMNAIQGKTAIKGGANDPATIQAKNNANPLPGKSPTQAFDPAKPSSGPTLGAGPDSQMAAKPTAAPTPGTADAARLPTGGRADSDNLRMPQSGGMSMNGQMQKGPEAPPAGSAMNQQSQNFKPAVPRGDAGDDNRNKTITPAAPTSPVSSPNINYNQKIPSNTPSGSSVSGADVNYNKPDAGNKTLVQRIGDFFGGGDKTPAAPAAAPAAPNYGAGQQPTRNLAPPSASSASVPAAKAPETDQIGTGASASYFEDGGKKKGKSKMSESALINAVLGLDANSSNIFEAAKKAKKDWDGDGKIESEKDEVWGSRFKAAKKAGKLQEDDEDPIGDMIKKMPKEQPKAAVPTPPVNPTPAPKKAPEKKNPDPFSYTGMKTVESFEEAMDALASGKLTLEQIEAIEEKYMGFKKLEKSLESKGAKNPAAVAAVIGRHKYGKAKFQKAAATGHKLKESAINKAFEVGDRVEIVAPGFASHGHEGTVTKIHPDGRHEVDLGKFVTGTQSRIKTQSGLLGKPGETFQIPPKTMGGSKTIVDPSALRRIKEEVELDEISKATYGKAIMARTARAKDAEQNDYDDSGEAEKQYGKFDRNMKAYTKKYGQKASDKMQRAVDSQFEGYELDDFDESAPIDSWNANAPAKRSGAVKKRSDSLKKVKVPGVQMEGIFSAEELRHLASFGESAVAPQTDKDAADVGQVSSSNVLDEDGKKKKGRPSKAEKDAENPNVGMGRDPRQHIQVQAGRAMAGVPIDFKHDNGDVSKLTAPMGRRIVAHLGNLKPAERQAAVNKMHASAEGLKV